MVRIGKSGENRNMSKYFMLFFIGCFLFMICPVQAQSTSANFSQGSVKIGPDTRDCDSSREASVRWNSSTSCMEYCDGTDWTCPASVTVGCTPDPTCPNVGNVCSGTGSGGGNPKFAGCMCYYDANGADAGTCKALYVTQADQSSTWKTSTGTNDIATDSYDDGKINDGQVANSTDFPAFKLCKDLSDGGYTDWYLPARNELDLLWRNSGAITGFTSNYYWSSSEYTTNSAWYQYFYNGVILDLSKNNNRFVRCVRRD